MMNYPMFGRIMLGALLALAVAALGGRPALAVPPAEIFGSPNEVGAPDLSPDGRYLAAIVVQGGKRFVSIRDLNAPGSKPLLIGEEGGRFDWISWANNTRLAIGFTIGDRTDDDTWISRVIAINPDGTNTTVLFANRRAHRANRNLSNIVGRDPANPNAVFMAAYDRNDYSLFRVDVMTGKAELVVRGDSSTVGWFVDAAGQPRARVQFYPRRRYFAYQIRDTVDSEWLTITTFARNEIPERRFVSFFGAGNTPVVIDQAAGPTAGFYELDPKTGSLGRKLFAHPRFDANGPVTDPHTGELMGYGYVADAQQYEWRDPEFRQIFADLKATFPEAWAIDPVSWSVDRSRIVVRTEGLTDSGTYHLYDRRRGEIGRFADRYPQITAAILSPVQAISYRARDGLTIPAYLTLPRGQTRNLPLVVMPHGGPEARDQLGFDFLAQFLASRGYAVLQPQFRGSAGFGRQFMLSGRKTWGLEMQHDVTDGVKHLIANGTADADRVCIFGWSYGGYAALAGGAYTPELYKCVVSVNGVSDLPEILDDERREGGRDGPAYRYWLKVIGDPSADRARLEATSPARHAARFQAPVLLVAGEKDTVVLPSQSKIMHDALQRAGKPVRYITFPSEDHSFTIKTDSRTKLMRELESFLAQHIGR